MYFTEDVARIVKDPEHSKENNVVSVACCNQWWVWLHALEVGRALTGMVKLNLSMFNVFTANPCQSPYMLFYTHNIDRQLTCCVGLP